MNILPEGLKKFIPEALIPHWGKPYANVALAIIPLAGYLITDATRYFAVRMYSHMPSTALLDVDVSWRKFEVIAGLLLAGLAAAVFLIGMRLEQRHSGSSAAPISSTKSSAVVAIRHLSFEGGGRSVDGRDLHGELSGANIIPLVIDQTAYHQNGKMEHPSPALVVQNNLISNVKAHLEANPGAQVAYYGKAHIPFVFVAGYDLSRDTPVHFFELDRANGDWTAILPGKGPDLGLLVEAKGPKKSDDAVIRVSISYPVGPAEVDEVIDGAHRDIHIRLAHPKVDAIRFRDQVDEIASKFQAALDDLRNNTGAKRIHVFCAAPMSVVFALGRRVNKTLHPPIWIYNYSASTNPRYAWAVRLNELRTPTVEMIAPKKEERNVQSA
ncbi:MAG: SAVED domain-containing protein [Alphaproteobacteria bacterium]